VAARRAAVLTVLLLLTGVVTGCGSDAEDRGPAAPRRPHGAVDAVEAWLGHLSSDDEAAFADLAPRSQAVVGDLGNYRRGSGRFSPTYERFAGSEIDDPVAIGDDLVVVTLRGTGSPTAVPVRRVDGAWRVEPLLDVGSFSHRPDDGVEVDARPTVTVQLDDPRARATVWFDGREAEADGSGTAFRPRDDLRSGTVVVTFAITRGEDIVARAFRLKVS
jgi:hypothetical protein